MCFVVPRTSTWPVAPQRNIDQIKAALLNIHLPYTSRRPPPSSFKVWDSQNAPPAAKQAHLSLLRDIWWEGGGTMQDTIPSNCSSKDLCCRLALVFPKSLILNSGCTLTSPGQRKHAAAWALPTACSVWMCLGWGPIGNFSNLLWWV